MHKATDVASPYLTLIGYQFLISHHQYTQQIIGNGWLHVSNVTVRWSNNHAGTVLQKKPGITCN